MSGIDRLTDEQLEGLVQEGDAAPWVSKMARELLAHRRASQAAPAPSDGLREAVDAAWNDAIEAAAKSPRDAGMEKCGGEGRHHILLSHSRRPALNDGAMVASCEACDLRTVPVTQHGYLRGTTRDPR